MSGTAVCVGAGAEDVTAADVPVEEAPAARPAALGAYSTGRVGVGSTSWAPARGGGIGGSAVG
ncbi:hypothetical protein, partial [Streptomyces sp. CO7]